MLWFALHLPWLSLEAFCATLPAEGAEQRCQAPSHTHRPVAPSHSQRPVAPSDTQRPVALVDEHRIASVNAAAARAGVQPGLKRATALALCSELLLAQADTARDAAALQAVAHAALAFTPTVLLHDAATVLLEVQSSLRYFGGPAALRTQLRAALAPLGHRVQWAAAPTPLGAALLARWGDDRHGDLAEGAHTTQLPALQHRLDAAPVWLLGPGREHWQALQGMGLTTLSDLRVLPRAGLARRFGEGLLDDLDRALGRCPDPQTPLALPPAFDSRIELFARADTTAQVLHGAGVLLARLVAWAQAQQARVAAFTLLMQHEPRRDAALPATVLQVVLAEPALDLAHLQLLLRERLARLALAAPTLELVLRCRDLVRCAPPNGELFPTRQSEAEGLTRLLERLCARLGDMQVQRLLPVADHRPERGSRSVPAQTAVARARPPPSPPSALPLHRPVWLLPEPEPLPARGALPLLRGRVLRLLSGPERIESGWWDGALAARDYFIAQADDGALLWVYRERLPPPEGEAAWFLHGRFA